MDKYGDQAIHLACEHNSLECLAILLAKESIDVNAPGLGGWRKYKQAHPKNPIEMKKGGCT
jgi:hypothetical protein